LPVKNWGCDMAQTTILQYALRAIDHTGKVIGEEGCIDNRFCGRTRLGDKISAFILHHPDAVRVIVDIAL
jgi:hypothetical protein